MNNNENNNSNDNNQNYYNQSTSNGNVKISAGVDSIYPQDNNIPYSELPKERKPKYNESALTPPNKGSSGIIVGIIILLVALLLFGVIGLAVTLDSEKDTTVEETDFFASAEKWLNYLFEEEPEKYLIYQGIGMYPENSFFTEEISIYTDIPQGYEVVDSYADDYNNYTTILHRYNSDIYCTANIFQYQSAEEVYDSLKRIISNVEHKESGIVSAPYGDAYLLEYTTNENGVEYYNISACAQVDEEYTIFLTLNTAQTDDESKKECQDIMYDIIEWQYIEVDN